MTTKRTVESIGQKLDKQIELLERQTELLERIAENDQRFEVDPKALMKACEDFKRSMVSRADQ